MTSISQSEKLSTSVTSAEAGSLHSLLWQPRHVRGCCILLALMSLLLFWAGSGGSLPLEAHEVFYARSATEMMRRDEIVIPYFNEAPRLRKPPLMYWLIIAAHEIIDGHSALDNVSEFAARTPSALAATGLVLSAVCLGALLMRSGWAGVIAGGLVLTSRTVIDMAHTARPEMLYACACSWGVVGLLLLYDLRHRENARRARFVTGLFTWTCFSAALLAKGPFLPLFILAGAGFALLGERSLRVLLRVLRPGTGVVLVLLTFVPWVLLVLQRVDAVELWRTEMFDRVGEGGQWWWQPLRGYYLLHTPLVVLPWLVLLPGSVMLPWQDESPSSRRARFLFWILVGPAFFLSFSVGSRWYYMLPTTGVLCALMAGGVVRAVERLHSRPRRHRLLSGVTRLHALFFLAAALTAIWALFATSRADCVEALPRWIGVGLLVGAALVALGALLLARARLHRGATLTFASWYLTTLAASSTGVAWRLEVRESEAAFGRAIAALLPPDSIVFASRCQPQTVVYYADRSVEHVAYRALAARLQEVSGELLITDEDAYRDGLVSGDILLEEQLEHDDSMVLLANPRLVAYPAPLPQQ